MNHNEEGFIVLVAVIIAGAVAATIASSLLLLSTTSAQTAFNSEQSYKAISLADYCAEVAMKQMYNNLSYSTAGTTVTVGSDSCVYIVTIGAGQARTVQSTGTVGTLKRKVQVDVTALTPKITYSSWREL